MILKRQLQQSLLDWYADNQRKPLLIRGARQVGKTSLIESFAQQHFNNCVAINFELSPEYIDCFQTLKPDEICNAIKIISRQDIIPGETLLFLDEIQDCPQAIQALRYFKECMPTLHVIGAGSLLELVLNQANFRMPVGRVSSLYLYPLSFKEYLLNVNPEVIEILEQATPDKPPPEAIHNHLLKQLQYYLLIGGMPECLVDFKRHHDFSRIQAIQADILSTYQNDFGHYGDIAKIEYLRRCFQKIPMMIGEQIKYNKIDPDIRSRELKTTLSVLEDAAIFNRVTATSAQGLPLDATLNEKKFKLNFIDVGLVKRVNQLDAQLLLSNDVMLLNRGALAEQFVGQELLAYAPSYEKAKLYFWARDAPATAEVDYIRLIGGTIFPIEVKAGKAGTLRSMQQYLKQHQCPFGIRISQRPLAMKNGILSVPLYMISELNQLIERLHPGHL